MATIIADSKFTTHNNDGTTTCGNGTLVVTLPTDEFARVGRYGVFNSAMRMLGNRSEAKILDSEPINSAEIMRLAHESLVFDYIRKHCVRYCKQILIRMPAGRIMTPSMEADVAKADAYADGVLSPITHEQLQDWAREMRLGVNGPTADIVLAEVTEYLERYRQLELERRRVIGNSCLGWRIEIVGKMPERIGLCRYQGGPVEP